MTIGIESYSISTPDANSKRDRARFRDYESSALFICMDGANLVGDNIKQKINCVKMNCALHIANYITTLSANI